MHRRPRQQPTQVPIPGWLCVRVWSRLRCVVVPHHECKHHADDVARVESKFSMKIVRLEHGEDGMYQIGKHGGNVVKCINDDGCVMIMVW